MTDNSAGHSRIVEIDAWRAFALLGVIVANAPYFAGDASLPVGRWPWLDQAVKDFTGIFVTGKFFLMFSFLFGFGFTVMMQRYPANSHHFAGQYSRRLWALFVFGVFHAIFLFVGDILMLYAVLGIVLWLTRKQNPRRLLIYAMNLGIIGILTQKIALWLLAGEAANPALQAAPTFGRGYLGGFGDVIGENLKIYPFVLPLLLLINAWLALAMFLAGQAAGRSNRFPPSQDWLERNRRKIQIGFLMAASISFGAYQFSYNFHADLQELSPFIALPASLILCAIAPVLSFCIATLVFDWFKRHRESRLTLMFACTGKSPLSGYILHSILLGGIFFGWGLGYYEQLPATAVFAASLAVFIVIVAALNVWEVWFLLGPMEWLWRSWIRMSWRPIWR